MALPRMLALLLSTSLLVPLVFVDANCPELTEIGFNYVAFRSDADFTGHVKRITDDPFDGLELSDQVRSFSSADGLTGIGESGEKLIPLWSSQYAYKEDAFYLVCVEATGCPLSCVPAQYRACDGKPLLYAAAGLETDFDERPPQERFYVELAKSTALPDSKLLFHVVSNESVDPIRADGSSNGSFSSYGSSALKHIQKTRTGMVLKRQEYVDEGIAVKFALSAAFAFNASGLRPLGVRLQRDQWPFFAWSDEIQPIASGTVQARNVSVTSLFRMNPVPAAYRSRCEAVRARMPAVETTTTPAPSREEGRAGGAGSAILPSLSLLTLLLIPALAKSPILAGSL